MKTNQSNVAIHIPPYFMWPFKFFLIFMLNDPKILQKLLSSNSRKTIPNNDVCSSVF